MNAFRSLSTMHLRHAGLFWLLLIALALRGMLPTGAMLSFDADRSISVVLCNAQGALTQISTGDGGMQTLQHAEICPFAFALSMAGMLATVPGLLILPGLPVVAASMGFSTSSAESHSYSARAPPIVLM